MEIKRIRTSNKLLLEVAKYILSVVEFREDGKAYCKEGGLSLNNISNE